MGNDLNKSLADVLNNMDKKALQENLSKALDMLQNSDTGELAKQIASASNSEQNSNLNNTDKSTLDKMNINADVMKNLNNADLEKFLKYIGTHSDEIKGKLKDFIK